MKNTKLRNHIQSLSSEILWAMFKESDLFETKGIVSEESMLRNIAKEYISDDNAMTLNIVFMEIYRELAVRGSEFYMQGNV